jgi:hypothetical protein
MSVNQVLIDPSAKAVVTLPIKDRRLRNDFEEQFRVTAIKLGAWLPSDPRLGIEAPFDGGKMLRLIFLGSRSPATNLNDALPHAPHLFIIKKNETILNVEVRTKAYMPLHTLVTGVGSQDIDQQRLELTLELLRALGPTYSGLFNRAGLTRDSFHAQIFQEVTPLQQAIQSARAVSQWKQVSKYVNGAVLRDWPASAVMFRGASPGAVAHRAVLATQQLKNAGLTYDLCFHFAQGEFWVVVFTRRSSSDEEWYTYSAMRKELGKFGALELSGIIVSVMDEQVFRAFIANPCELVRRYEEALADMATNEILDSLLVGTE